MRKRNDRQSALGVIGGFVVLIFLLVLFVAPQSIEKSNNPPFLSIAGAIMGGSLCVFTALFRLPPPGPLPTPQQFNPHMLIALAGAELVALLGIFMGSKQIGAWPFAILAWGLILGLVLPKTLRYFQLTEGMGQGSNDLTSR